MKTPLYSTIVLRNQSASLTVCQCKHSKRFNFQHSTHRNVTCPDKKKKIPETIQYHNATKYGFDVLNKNARLYTTKVASRRWPLLQVFHNIFDQAANNAVILYNYLTGESILPRNNY